MTNICHLLAIILTLLLGGCASPAARVETIATRLGLTTRTLQGGDFGLVGYRNRAAAPGGRLHVYLEGDGTPWRTRSRIARDPTPRNPLALRLMALDPAPALYLARPCYNVRTRALGCDPWLWTSGRYSERVVASMATALNDLIDEESLGEITLIGYSGGGVLAWLLAQRIAQVRTLVTIAANLDIDRWTDLHGYSRLGGSLNPAAGPAMRPDVEQWHLIGTADTNVPAEITRRVAHRLGREARLVSVASDHRCCWLGSWPEMLRRLDRGGSTPTPGDHDSGANDRSPVRRHRTIEADKDPQEHVWMRRSGRSLRQRQV